MVQHEKGKQYESISITQYGVYLDAIQNHQGQSTKRFITRREITGNYERNISHARSETMIRSYMYISTIGTREYFVDHVSSTNLDGRRSFVTLSQRRIYAGLQNTMRRCGLI